MSGGARRCALHWRRGDGRLSAVAAAGVVLVAGPWSRSPTCLAALAVYADFGKEPPAQLLHRLENIDARRQQAAVSPCGGFHSVDHKRSSENIDDEDDDYSYHEGDGDDDDDDGDGDDDDEEEDDDGDGDSYSDGNGDSDLDPYPGGEAAGEASEGDSLPDFQTLPSVRYTRQRTGSTWQSLCRVQHSAKDTRQRIPRQC